VAEASEWQKQAAAAEKAGQIELARHAARRWLELAPGGAAAAMLKRLDDAEEAARWQKQALAAQKAGQHELALMAGRRWLELAPGSKPARAFMKRLERASSTPAARKPAPKRQRAIWQRIGLDMVRIPRGPFLYGDDKRRLVLREFYLARTPVTNTQYKEFVDATGHRPPKKWRQGQIPGGKQDHPVTHVDWDDALAFCKWAGCRLPTEEEWEKAARGPNGRIYPWGDDWRDGCCNGTFSGGATGTTPVGMFPDGDSPYGLKDMAGNVYEWCEASADMAGWSKPVRGGYWNTWRKKNLRCAKRDQYPAGTRNTDIGFRCAMSAPGRP
jgi:formylglycine-generating enzyme required for sulfatase activity